MDHERPRPRDDRGARPHQELRAHRSRAGCVLHRPARATVTGFLGPNGAGKSTTMRMIIGLDRPDAGQATVNGKPYSELRWPLREVGAMLEAKAFHPGRSARAPP